MNVTADELRRIRKVYMLTLEEMAALCDCSAMLISMIERNQRSLTESIARRLVDELQLTPAKKQEILQHYDTYNLKGE